MKLSADPKHWDYDYELARSATVLLNSQPVKLCTYADEESGFIDRILTDSEGKPLILNGRLLYDRIFGVVHVCH